jgi:hypothetical protein
MSNARYHDHYSQWVEAAINMYRFARDLSEYLERVDPDIIRRG